MTTGLYLARCYDIGLVYDIFTEKGNDNCEYATLATQEDFDRW